MRPLPVALVALLLVSSAKAIEWPQFHADELHTGYIASDFAAPSDRWWSQSTGGPIEGSPVVSDGRVFIGSTDGKLYAFDAISGSPLWTFDAGSPISSTPALSGGILYLVTNDGKLFAIDAVTGKKRLSAGQGSPDPSPSRTSPSIHEGRLYIGTEAGTVIAYSLQTLTKDWEFRIADEQKVLTKTFNNQTNQWSGTCEPRFAAKPIRSSPAVYRDRVFFGSDVHALFGVDEFGLGGTEAGRTTGVWTDSSFETCPKAWPVSTIPAGLRYPMAEDVLRSAPAIDTRNNLVVVPSFDNNVYAFDVGTGVLKWKFNVSMSNRDSRVSTTPAVVDGKVYFGSFNGRFYGVETTTSYPYVRELWHFDAGDAIWSSPAISNGLVAFGADDETVYVLNASTGQEQWRFRAGGDVRSSPAIWTGGVVGAPIQGGVLYVGSSDGILYAFGSMKPALADLLIANLTYPKDPLPIDSDVELNVTVRNGGESASPVTELKVYIDGALASTQPVVALARGESTNLKYVWHVPNQAVNHTLRVVVDAAGAVREFDRGNNELKVDTPVAKTPPPPPPPPTPTNTTEQVPPPKKKSPGPELLVLAGAAALLALATRRRRR